MSRSEESGVSAGKVERSSVARLDLSDDEVAALEGSAESGAGMPPSRGRTQ